MNEQIKQLEKDALYFALQFRAGLNGDLTDYETEIIFREKFAELIVQECARLNLELSYELAGVIVDTEEGIGFDSVCLNTVKQVHNSLASNQLTEHFGVEE